MNKTDPTPAIPDLMSKWITMNMDVRQLGERLRELGCDAEAISAHLKEFNQLKRKKRQAAGFIWAGIGAFLGFVSCVLALTNPIPALHDLFLYGLTSAAAVIIFWGLYLVFE